MRESREKKKKKKKKKREKKKKTHPDIHFNRNSQNSSGSLCTINPLLKKKGEGEAVRVVCCLLFVVSMLLTSTRMA